ncbi:MAG TPA: adenylate/guanylate cyclase domain-containing protein [Stellaceae bacterium]|nr:adenylate/guanylate cyclase domain-containing protein [Stellaceae bacterium]
MVKLRALFKTAIDPIAVAVLCAGIAFIMTHEIAFLTQAERFVGDMRIATLLPPEPQDNNIVIAAVNEDTLKLFPYRSPVDRAFLANLLKALDAKGPRAIAMDILLDQATEPAKDEALKEEIRAIKTPLVISYTSNPELVDAKQLAYVNDFVPLDDRVAAEIPTDAFGVVRWILPKIKEADGTYMLDFARGLLAKVGMTTPDAQPDMVWHGRPNAETPAFKEFPAHLVPVIPAAWIKGKIVLIGEVVSLTDRHRTPFSSVYGGNEGALAGIEIHANAVAQLLEGTKPRNLGTGAEITLVLLMALVGAGLGALQIPLLARIAAGFLSFALLWGGGFALFRFAGISIALISPTIAGGLSQWGTDMVTGRQVRRQREFIQQAFGKFVAPGVVQRLVADPEKLALEGEQREMTFLFTDIANFTTLSEKLAQKEREDGKHRLAPLLNEYLDRVCAEILKLEGTIDKFIGDAVMAVFNAPADQSDHAERGVKCALAIQRCTEAFRAEMNASFAKEYPDEDIQLGVTRVGVHTGTAVVGNFGSHDKMQYTALGDTVNTASRLEGVNKYFGTHICVSETTRLCVSDIPFRPIHVIVPKGREEALGIFEPLDEERAHSDYVMRYVEAYELAEHRDPRAVKLFEQLKGEAPEEDQLLLGIHVERLRQTDEEAAYGPMVMHDK